MSNKFFKHLGMVTKHRFIVFKLCCKCGLFWRGLTHDLSKFSPTEFFESVKYYTGVGSPISNCRRQKGYSLAWIHHINHNKHHFEYWFDLQNKTQVNMPYKYAVECICDRISASKCYMKEDYTDSSPLEYWIKHLDQTPTNDNMKSFFSKVFTDLKDYGEQYVLNKKYLKETYDDIVIKNNV